MTLSDGSTWQGRSCPICSRSGSKETAMTFPLVLLLWDVVIRRLDAVSLRRTLSHHIIFRFGSCCWRSHSWAWSHPALS